ncbi:MAG: hypothetical protein ACE5HV_08550 [Acidobacteriota bacterium]
MALKDTVKDPLNWVLLILALAFGYYVVAVPYWTNYYLKTPQAMTMADYLANPSHPRPFKLHALGSPPSSIELVITDLVVSHIDADSILLETGTASSAAPPAALPAVPTAEQQSGGASAEEATAPVMGEEQPPPKNQILLAGDNMDLKELSVGQEVSLQVHGLYESSLGWVPQEANLEREQEEFFTKEELDELDRFKIISNGNSIAVPYVETGELRFASGVHPPGQPTTLERLANDTRYIQTVNRLAGGTADLTGARLVSRALEEQAPYFLVEDAGGRRARVFYNPRLLSEWYWALDRLQSQPVVVRGTLRPLAPAALRQLETDGNVQAIMDGFEIMSPDGATVISLENPAGGLGST